MSTVSDPSLAHDPVPTGPGLVAPLLKPLLVALDRRRAYGASHPTAREAEAAFAAQLAPPLAAAGRLELQVARDTLLVGGVECDAPRALLGQLATRLHRRGVGAIVFEPPVVEASLHGLLGHLVADADPDATDAHATDWTAPGVTVVGVRYDRLVLGETNDRVAEDAVAACWRALARVAARTDDDEPSQIARTLATGRLGTAKARAAAAALTALAASAEVHPAAREAIAAHLAMVLQRLGPGAVAAILRDLDAGRDRAALLDTMCDALPVDVVAAWLEVAADAQQQELSQHLLRLFGKLSRTATGAPVGRADAAVRESARAIVADWTLANPNPEEHMRLLERITAQVARGIPREADAPARDAHEVEAERVVQFALETDCDLPVVRAAARAMATSGQLPLLLDWLQRGDGTAIARTLRAVLLADDAVIGVIVGEHADVAAADAMIGTLGVEAADLLMDILGAARTRTVRRAALVRLRTLGSPVAPALGARLATASPELARNLLVLLRDLDVRRPEVVRDAHRCLAAPASPALRSEAMRFLARLPDERVEAVRRALRDDSSRVVAVAVQAVHDHADAIRAAGGHADELRTRLVDLAADPARDERTRIGAVLAAGALGGPAVRDGLLGLVSRRTRVLRRQRLVEPGPVAVAALFVLRRDFRDDPTVAPLLDRAARDAAAARWLAVPVLAPVEERP